jgi:hypothetical protein
MPRDGSGVYDVPPGTQGSPNTTILSAAYNAFLADLITDLNAARPVTAGGTGGTSQISGWDGLTAKGTDIASAGTINLTTATGPRIDITGTTTVTAVTLASGSIRIARATGIFQITASASLIVNKSTSVNYTTAVGDLLIFIADGSVVSVTAIGGGGTFATNAQALAASSTTLSVNPANLASLIQNINNNAFNIADLQGVRLNMVGGIADAYDSETDVDTATSTNESYDSGNDLYSPTSTGATMISAATGTVIGDMTVGGGNAAAFNGTTSAIVGAGTARKDTSPAFIGKDWGSGNTKTISRYKVYGSSDVGLASAATFDIKLQGSTDNFSSSIVDLHSATGVSDSNAIILDYTSGITTTTAYRYHRVLLTSGGSEFYVAEVEFYNNDATINNMTLVSNAFTATAVPTQARVAVFIDPQVSITINTDFTAEVSRDGGTTWTAVTLALVSNPVGTVEQYEGTVSISSQPSGSSMKYRLKTLNNKDIDVTGIVFQWS